MWLSRLPPDYRRRYYTNMAILIGLVALVLNLWRLGPHYGPLAVVLLIGLSLLYLSTWPLLRLVRAKPQAERSAFVLAGAYIAGFVYFTVSFFTPLPGSFLALIVGVVLLWVFLIKYRGIIFSSLFNRDGAFSERLRPYVRRKKRTKTTRQPFKERILLQSRQRCCKMPKQVSF